MRILALDQATKTSGYSIFEDGVLLEYGKFTYDDADLGKRLVKIRNKVKSLLLDNNIDELIFEDIQYQAKINGQYGGVKNVDTFKKLAEVYGVISELASELNIPSHCVLAGSWRSKLKIKGIERADAKRNTQQWVNDKFNIKATQDECDAIGIGEYYW